MVHRPADSRLLANLLAHEKEHAKALHQLSTTAQASLAPLAAYAAASTPSAAAALGAASRALSQADGALRAYAEAVDEWRAMLSELKGLEDEVGNIQRDREILVTRLIKASNIKPTSPNRNSFIGVTSSTYSTANSSKLDLAQSELQACETHLASKERDLQALRALALSRGLKSRCTAMSECGWQWNEAGKEGLRALEDMDRALPNGFTGDSALAASQFHKPLPDPKPLPVPDHVRRPSSDISSSLAPSQSASQIADEGLASADISPNIGSYDSHHPLPLPPSLALPPTHPYAAHIMGTPPRPGARGLLDLPSPSERQSYRLSIPPAHSISDHHIPPRIERRITEGNEEDEEGGSSVEEGGEVDEEMDATLEVHENRPFENALALAAGQKAANLNAMSMNGDARPPEEVIGAPAPFTPMRMETLNNPPMNGGGMAQSDVGPRRRSPPPRRVGRASPDHAHSPGQTYKRERKGSFFGTIAGLFRTHPRTGGGEGSTASGSQPPSPIITRSSPSKVSKSGRWRMRSTRKGKGKRDDDSSDDEGGGGMSDTAIDYGALARKSAMERKALPVPRSSPTPMGGVNGAGSGGSSTTVTMGAQTGKRLTKKSRRGGKSGSGAGAPRPSRPEGWMSEGIASPPADVDVTVRQRKLVNGTGSGGGSGQPLQQQDGPTMTVMRSGTVRSAKSNTSAASAPVSTPGGTMKKKKKSPNGSGSAVSAPVAPTTPTSPTVMTKRKPVRATSLDYTYGASASPSRTYTLSSGSGSDAPLIGGGTKRSDTWSPKQTHGHGHGHSMDSGRPGASLMTIVEGVTRANREAWSRNDPNALLVGVKAPPPVTDFALDGPGHVRHPISRSEVNLNDDIGFGGSGRGMMTGVGANGNGNGGGTVMRRLSSASTPNLATTGSPSPAIAVILHAPTPKHDSETPQKMPVPLRSALRNRTPSPVLPLRNGSVIRDAPAFGMDLSPSHSHSPAAKEAGEREKVGAGMSSDGPSTLKTSNVSAAPHTPPAVPAATKANAMDDNASITSQETNDVFEDAEEFVVTTPSAEDPPELATPKATTNDFSFSSAQSGATITDTPHMPSPTPGNANDARRSSPLSPEAIAAIPVPPVPSAPPPNPPPSGSEMSYSSGSTSTAMGGGGSHAGATAPARKKSVRVSLQPTFSPTPPAIDYEDDDDEDGEGGDGAHPPWSGRKEKETTGWPSREQKTGDAAWEDSSDEDEEYAQARRLLAKVERRMEKVKKRVGGSRRNADD